MCWPLEAFVHGTHQPEHENEEPSAKRGAIDEAPSGRNADQLVREEQLKPGAGLPFVLFKPAKPPVFDVEPLFDLLARANQVLAELDLTTFVQDSPAVTTAPKSPKGIKRRALVSFSMLIRMPTAVPDTTGRAASSLRRRSQMDSSLLQICS
jgi:hypothetical protein